MSCKTLKNVFSHKAPWELDEHKLIQIFEFKGLSISTASLVYKFVSAINLNPFHENRFDIYWIQKFGMDIWDNHAEFQWIQESTLWYWISNVTFTQNTVGR